MGCGICDIDWMMYVFAIAFLGGNVFDSFLLFVVEVSLQATYPCINRLSLGRLPPTSKLCSLATCSLTPSSQSSQQTTSITPSVPTTSVPSVLP
jgi:hypothetical protein